MAEPHCVVVRCLVSGKRDGQAHCRVSPHVIGDGDGKGPLREMLAVSPQDDMSPAIIT